MKVLVTGASGFLGGHVVQELLARGHLVRALVRAESDTSQLAGAEHFHGSLDDAPCLAAALGGVDAVVHAAGLVKARSREEFQRVNVEGTRRLVEAALPRASLLRRFVHVSSMAAGGPSPTPAPREPGAPDEPVTTYGRSKLAGERVVLGEPRLPSCAIRPPAIYGPRDRESLPVFRLAARGLRLGLRGGVTHVSMGHARACARAIAALVEGEPPAGRIYPVDDGAVHEMAEVGRRIADAVGRRTVEIPVPLGALRLAAAAGETWARLSGRSVLLDRDKVAEFAARHWVAGHAAITSDVGWLPAIALPDGMRETAGWYRDQGWL
jgi:nucleoside-diphosphate-sugar epimerase